MAKLNISTVSDKEAAEHLLGILSALNFSSEDKDIVCYPKGPDGEPLKGPDGLPVRIQYKLSDVPKHVRAWLNGTKDGISIAIAFREIKFAKKDLVNERRLGHTT